MATEAAYISGYRALIGDLFGTACDVRGGAKVGHWSGGDLRLRAE
jgi:hypothetical protein